MKSGYGLDLENERKSLEVARQLGEERPVTVRTTFLGAHATPPEASADTSAYIDAVVNEMLLVIAVDGLADAVDGFCEGVAFSPEEIARVFDAATALDLPLKLHADQLSDLGGGALAARYGALSADHLEYTSEESVRAMNMAATLFGLTVEECLLGSTRVAAKVLGVQNDTGTLEVGKRADFATWDIDEPAELVYLIGFNPLHQRVWRGAATTNL